MLERFAPIVDTISQKECIEKGWISDIIKINLSIPLSQREVSNLAEVDKKIRNATSKFGSFDALRNCMNMESAKSYAAMYYPNEDRDDKAKELLVMAVNGHRLIKKRQEFLYKTERKVDAAVELITEFQLKTITFSQSTDFADEVAEKLGPTAVRYHSNVTTITKEVRDPKVVSRRETAIKLVACNPGATFSLKDGKYEVLIPKTMKLGKKKQLEDAANDFKSGSNNIRTICTAKALDAGADFNDAELGLDCSRTSNPTQETQRTGRIARNFVYPDGTKKRGVYINLYIQNSQDEVWLRACQSKHPESVIWLDDIDEVKKLVKKALNI